MLNTDKLYLKYCMLIFIGAGFTSQAISGPTNWTSPQGFFSVQIPDGWQMIPPEEIQVNAKSKAILAITPEHSPGSKVSLGCSAFILDHVAAGPVRQAIANSVIESWTKDTLLFQARATGPLVISVFKFSNLKIDDVQVASIEYGTKQEGVSGVYSASQFMLAKGGSDVSFYTVACFMPLGSDQAVEEDIATFLSSLAFTSRINF